MRAMAKIEIAYVKAYRDRHRRMRYYYRRKGLSTVALPGEPGTAEFMAAYAEADARAPRSNAEIASEKAAARVQPRSINGLIIQYYQTAEFKELADSTRRAYRGQLDRFRAVHGDKGALSIGTHHLEAIFIAMAERPEAAVNLRKRLRRVFRLAVRLGVAQGQPRHRNRGRPQTRPGHQGLVRYGDRAVRTALAQRHARAPRLGPMPLHRPASQ